MDAGEGRDMGRAHRAQVRVGTMGRAHRALWAGEGLCRLL